MFVRKKHIKKLQQQQEETNKLLQMIVSELQYVNKLNRRKPPYMGGTLWERAFLDSVTEIENNPMFDEVLIKYNYNTYVESICQKVQHTSGMYLEFGVFKGDSINLISKQAQHTTVYGFDSFEGLPESWAGTSHEPGDYTTNNILPEVNDNVTLIKGWFDESLPVFVQEHKEELEKNKVGFIHVDCDLYSSTKTIFDILQPYIIPGTMIMFDELMGYTKWRNGEWKALHELLEQTGYGFKMLEITNQGESLIPRMAGVITEKK